MPAEIAPIADLPDGRGVRVDVGDHRIAVFRTGDTVHAIGDRCSHADASLSEGDLFDGEVECPRHGSPFNLASGKPSALPATSPVPVYPATVENGIVYLNIEGAS
jgi:3-phenylpropionate/trans-cinnamate dioxygenase ferredoxin subunit